VPSWWYTKGPGAETIHIKNLQSIDYMLEDTNAVNHRQLWEKKAVLIDAATPGRAIQAYWSFSHDRSLARMRLILNTVRLTRLGKLHDEGAVQELHSAVHRIPG